MTKISSARVAIGAVLFVLVSCGEPYVPAGPNTVSSGQATVVELQTTFEGMATSFDQRGNDRYSVGYFVEDGSLVAENSLLPDGDREISTLDLDIVARGEGFSAVIAKGEGTELELTGSIIAQDFGEGRGASDFSGLGAMVIASDHADVTLDAMNIVTYGILRAAFISDEYASVMVRDSMVRAMGANSLTDLFEGYANGANMRLMLSPPWVLGIQGAVRVGNMLGESSTLSVVNSSVTSGGWAVLSTDAGRNARMNVVDSTLRVLPEDEGGMTSGPFAYGADYGTGYGTYLIGNSVQNFYGVNFEGMTYASIFTGGEAYYRSSNGEIGLLDASGGEIETVVGGGQPTVIDTVFGFMTDGGAAIHVLDGTQVNSREASFLYKAGNVEILVDDAQLNPGSGVILQMIDNDDRTVGGSMEAFNTEFNEDAGWPSENGNVTPDGIGVVGGPPGGPPPGGPDGMGDGPGGPPGPPGGPGGAMGPIAEPGVAMSLTNGDYRGDVFNGTGYYMQGAVPLEVTIGEGASLTGAITLTETRHVDENGEQNTYFTINEYYYLGHVENRNYRNGFSEVDVILEDGGVWTVTGESYLSSLAVNSGSVVGAGGRDVILTVDGVPTVVETGGRYEGDVVVSLTN